MIRIIIRKDNEKLLNDANILNNIIKNSFIYVCEKSNYLDNNDNILFNLYIDDALESEYLKFKLQKNILIYEKLGGRINKQISINILLFIKM